MYGEYGTYGSTRVINGKYDQIRLNKGKHGKYRYINNRYINNAKCV